MSLTIVRTGMAGTLESCDASVLVEAPVGASTEVASATSKGGSVGASTEVASATSTAWAIGASTEVAVATSPKGTAASPGLQILVESADRRFAGRVREAAEAALAELGVEAARVTVRDRSALDCTIRARVLAACLRAAGVDEPDWGGLR